VVPTGIGLWFGILCYLLSTASYGSRPRPGKRLSAHSKGLAGRNFVSAHSEMVSGMTWLSIDLIGLKLTWADGQYCGSTFGLEAAVCPAMYYIAGRHFRMRTRQR
jgi:hypothetical protein